MLEDRFGHFRALTRVQGIVAAHDPLQRGHFHDHVRHQIGFCELGGASGCVSIPIHQPKHRDQLFDNALDTVGLIQHRAELELEGKRRQARGVLFQLVLHILTDEEGSVGKAGADHLLVAIGDYVNVLAAAVAHRDEVRHQLAICGADGEVALVLLHHRYQHFGGQAQMILFEAAQQGCGRFNKLGHFVQQGVVHLFGCACFALQVRHLIGNHATPLFGVQQDALLRQRVKIIRRALHGDSLRFFKAQAARFAARLQTGVGERHHLAIQQGQQPADGA